MMGKKKQGAGERDRAIIALEDRVRVGSPLGDW